jgi:hypothetical protein
MSGDAITQAWLDKGSHPRYHDAQIARLRSEWPVLADAIERHVREQQGPSGDLPVGVRPHSPQTP